MLVEKELNKFKTFDLSYFKGKSYFEGNDRAQNALVFQAMQKHFDLRNGDEVSKWKSKVLSGHQYLGVIGTLGDVLLNKPIKPIHVISK